MVIAQNCSTISTYIIFGEQAFTLQFTLLNRCSYQSCCTHIPGWWIHNVADRSVQFKIMDDISYGNYPVAINTWLVLTKNGHHRRWWVVSNRKLLIGNTRDLPIGVSRAKEHFLHEQIETEVRHCFWQRVEPIVIAVHRKTVLLRMWWIPATMNSFYSTLHPLKIVRYVHSVIKC